MKVYLPPSPTKILPSVLILVANPFEFNCQILMQHKSPTTQSLHAGNVWRAFFKTVPAVEDRPTAMDMIDTSMHTKTLCRNVSMKEKLVKIL